VLVPLSNVPVLFQFPDIMIVPLTALNEAGSVFTKLPDNISAPDPRVNDAPAPAFVSVPPTDTVPLPLTNAALFANAPPIIRAPDPPLNVPAVLLRLFLIRIMPT